MVAFALNQITVPHAPFRAFVTLAARLDCVGVEARNDLGRPLFDGIAPSEAGRMVRDAGLRLVGVSQVYPFNVWTDEIAAETRALIDTAAIAGAETISLIPRNDGAGADTRKADLAHAVDHVLRLLEGTDITALIEPLGFARASLRLKSEVVAAIDTAGAGDRIKLVHDTFHHCLAEEDTLFPQETGLIHISGVDDPQPSLMEMEDAHRGLINAKDRTGAIAQIAAMRVKGFDGPVSFECFAPQMHALADPEAALRRSMNFVASHMAANAA